MSDTEILAIYAGQKMEGKKKPTMMEYCGRGQKIISMVEQFYDYTPTSLQKDEPEYKVPASNQLMNAL